VYAPRFKFSLRRLVPVSDLTKGDSWMVVNIYTPATGVDIKTMKHNFKLNNKSINHRRTSGYLLKSRAVIPVIGNRVVLTPSGRFPFLTSRLKATSMTPGTRVPPYSHFSRQDALMMNIVRRQYALPSSFLRSDIKHLFFLESWRSAYPHLLGHPMARPLSNLIPPLSSALFVSLRDANAPTSPWQHECQIPGQDRWEYVRRHPIFLLFTEFFLRENTSETSETAQETMDFPACPATVALTSWVVFTRLKM
jgi:hypothetical protein